MRVVDPGHHYELHNLDGNGTTPLVFVKREGGGYPGNVGHHEGTNLQDVWRACIDRLKYLNRQIPDHANELAIMHMRCALMELEIRAANRHNRPVPEFIVDVETMPFCPHCGHIGCPSAEEK
jgi:hypothetical protein